MDIKKRIREIVYSPDILREDFYSDKVRMVLFQKKNWKKELVKDKEVLETIRKHFPEVEIKSTGINVHLIKLKNADFYIKVYGKRKTIDVKINRWSCSYYVSDIPNLIEYMKEIDSQMPEWEREFAQLLEQNENEIKKVEHKSVLYGTEIRQILENRIKLRLMECRKNNTLPEIKKSFENIHVRTDDWCNALYINTMDQFEVWFQSTEFNVELLEQIDKIMPAWIEELNQWNHEYEKLKKAKDLSKISITELIKQKMKQLGYEYNITPNMQSITLYIRLEKTRMFKLSLPYRSIEVVNKRLDMLAEAVKAVNNIDNAFRITNEQKYIRWERESQR